MKQMLIPIMSAIIGVIAFFLTHLYIEKVNKGIDDERLRLQQQFETTVVIVASKDIVANEKITKEMLGTLTIQKSLIKPQHITVEEHTQIFGKRARFSIPEGSPIEWSSIDLPYARGSELARIVKTKLRAVSINVGGNNAVSSLIAPNDRVDVLGTFTFPAEDKPGEVKNVTLTILQDVTVLATGQTMANDNTARFNAPGRQRAYSTVTLEVTPSEAELLVFAENSQGRLTLTLRNPLDPGFLDQEELESVNFDHLQNKIPEFNRVRQREVLKHNR